MHLFSLNAFSRITGERPKTVKKLVSQGDISGVKKRCDRLEFTADAALDYLAKKYPRLIASKSECNGLLERGVSSSIVKQGAAEQIVKKGQEKGTYIYDNYVDNHSHNYDNCSYQINYLSRIAVLFD